MTFGADARRWWCCRRRSGRSSRRSAPPSSRSPRTRRSPGAFSVTELLGTYKTLNELGYSIIWTFVWIAVGYLIMTLAISALFNVLEKRWGVAR